MFPIPTHHLPHHIVGFHRAQRLLFVADSQVKLPRQIRLMFFLVHQGGCIPQIPMKIDFYAFESTTQNENTTESCIKNKAT
jgi:hypothetical protein